MAIKCLVFFSITTIILGLLSISLGIATLVIDKEYLTYKYFDMIGAGIWAGCFYVIAGGFGSVASSSRRNNRILLLLTMIFAILSIPASIAVLVLSSFDAFFSENECTVINSVDDYYCDIHLSLEKSLIISSIIAGISSIIVILMTSLNCCCGRKNHQHA